MIYSILSILVFSVFLLILIKKNNNKVPGSISEGYYLFKENTARIFYFITYPIFCALLFAVNPSPLMFFACSSICFVGAATDYRGDELTAKVHYLGASLGIALAILSLWIDYDLWWLTLLLTSVILFVGKYIKINRTFWLELMAFYGVALSKFIISIL